MSTEKTPTRESRASLVTFLALLALILGLAAAMTRPFLLAVFMGGVLALVTHPLYRRLTRRGWGPRQAAGAVTLAILFMAIAPLALFATMAVKQGVAFARDLSDNGQLSEEALAGSLRRVEARFPAVRMARQQLRDMVREGAKAAASVVVGLTRSVPDAALQLLLVVVACFFLLKDGESSVAALANELPLDPDIRGALLSAFQNTTVSTVWAGAAAAAAQSLVALGAFALLGIPAPFLAAGLTFICSWLPIIGSLPVTLLGMGYLYSESEFGKMAAMGAFGVLCGLIDNVIRPLILRGRGDMHPLVAFVSIIGGISMFGIVGVFVGPIVAAMLLSLLQTWPIVGRRYGLTIPAAPQTSKTR